MYYIHLFKQKLSFLHFLISITWYHLKVILISLISFIHRCVRRLMSLSSPKIISLCYFVDPHSGIQIINLRRCDSHFQIGVILFQILQFVCVYASVLLILDYGEVTLFHL